MNYVKAIKGYGQNFLKNEAILEKIAEAITTKENDLIIEIGPGMGALTKKLKEKGSFLIGYEIDERMNEYLKPLEDDKTKFIYGDFLKQNVLLDIQDIKYENIYVIANIPYYITSPIIFNLIESNISYKTICLLVQKEVAERITQENNTLSLSIEYLYQSELLFFVGKNNFIPAPKVDSAVIRLQRKDEAVLADRSYYYRFVKQAFAKKRKTLKNNLIDYDWSIVKDILANMGYGESVRAEEIARIDFINLVKEYKNRQDL